MSNVEVEVKVDIERVRQRLGKISRSMRPEMAEMVGSIGTALLERIRRMLSGERLKVRTGRLKSAWQIIRESLLRVRVAARGVRYAAIHEFGGTIVPRRAPYLHFRVDGRWVKTTRVVLPARYYVRDSLWQVQQVAGRRALGVVRRIVSR